MSVYGGCVPARMGAAYSSLTTLTAAWRHSMWLLEQSARSTRRRMLRGMWAMHAWWHKRMAHRCSSLSATSRIAIRNELWLQTANAQRAASHAHTILHGRTITRYVFGVGRPPPTRPHRPLSALLWSLDTPAWLPIATRTSCYSHALPTPDCILLEDNRFSNWEECCWTCSFCGGYRRCA